MALEKISDQFQGLPMESLIGGPLTAACDAQVMLANATAKYINTVGFDPAQGLDNGYGTLRNVKFSFERPMEIPAAGPGGGAPVTPHPPGVETVSLTVPLLAMVPVPNLQVDKVDITFDMEVKSSEQHKDSDDKEIGLEAELSGQVGPFKVSVKVHGKIASHQENTRSSDNSAKYHVGVVATNHGMPEGLARVFDIMATSIAPVTTSRPDKPFPTPTGTPTVVNPPPQQGLPPAAPTSTPAP